MEWKASAGQHDHRLSMPEIINVRNDIAGRLHDKTVNNCCEPQVNIATTTPTGCTDRQTDRHADILIHNIMCIIMY